MGDFGALRTIERPRPREEAKNVHPFLRCGPVNGRRYQFAQIHGPGASELQGKPDN
jgi:hypothetical protein